MKKTSFQIAAVVFLLVMDYTTCYSQNTFLRNYGDINNQFGFSVKQCKDNGYIIAGYSTSNWGLLNMYVLRTDSKGDSLWAITKSGGIQMGGRDVIQTKDENFVVSGYKCITNYDGIAILMKIDKNGKTLWESVLKEDQFFLNAIIETSDGSIIAAGGSMTKTNPEGIIDWDIPWLNFPGNAMFLIDADESTVVAFGNQDWNNRLFLTKIKKSSGTFVWKKYFNGYIHKQGNNCLAKTSDGGFIITAQEFSEEIAILTKMDANGILTWTKLIPTALYGTSVIQTPDGGYVVGGKSNTGYMFLMKTDQQGNEQWSRYFTNFENGEVKSLQMTSDGGFILAGGVNSLLNGEDIVLVKTDSEGNLLKTFAPNISKSNSTYQFYPNPFSYQTVLKTNGYLSNATLTVYTSLGKEMKKVPNISGQSFILSRDNLPNGLYFYNISENNKIIATGKLEAINN